MKKFPILVHRNKNLSLQSYFWFGLFCCCCWFLFVCFLYFSKHIFIFMLKLWATSSTSPFGSTFKGTVAHILFLVLLICSLLMFTLKFRATFYKAALSSSQYLPALRSCTRPTWTLHSSHVHHQLFLKAMMVFKFAKALQSNLQSILNQPYTSDMKIRSFSFCFPVCAHFNFSMK